MNYHIACSSAILCSFLATGCSTTTINQTEKVTTTAEAYTSYVNQLLDETKTRVIDMDTKQLVISRSNDNRKENEKKLAQKNRALDEWVTVANQLQEQNSLLQKYFSALQLLIEAPSGNSMSQPLSNISNSISKINQTEADRRGEIYRDRTLTPSQVGNVAGLSETLISSHYAAKVKQVLIRDRNIIDKQIALHEQQLGMLASMYKRRTRLDNAEHYANNVLGPYRGVTPESGYDPGSWSQARNQWFKRKKELTEFDDAKDAGKAFREAWRDILQGKKDIGAVKAILGEANNLVGNAYQLHDSYHNPPQHNIYVVPQVPQ